MNGPADTSAAHGAPTAVRQDIQFLRGIAVLAVLFYHSKIVPMAGGYLGVDIFFVISGFLITKNILDDIARQRFSFADFYARRARRLLPAAYCTLFVTTLLASRVLTEDRWQDFIDQLIGAVTFTANFALPQQTGYFSTGAETKPLLHTWSLSVEEQYYLLAPLVLVVLRPSWRFATLLALAIISLMLCIFLSSSQLAYWRVAWLDSQQFAFFMLPARAWEMLAGSLLACSASRWAPFAAGRAVKLIALGALCTLCILPIDPVHPRSDALLAVLLTALLIRGNDRWLGHGLPVRMIARVGDWSYSLYLVHWPLLALASSAFIGPVPTLARVVIFMLSLVLAYLQYEYVEQRFRHRQPAVARRQLRWLGAATVAVLVLPFALSTIRLGGDTSAYAYLQERNNGLGTFCAGEGAVRDPQACSTAPNPRVALWGDSYAMHLIPGLKELDSVGPSMIQITKAACAPVRGVASIDANHDENWARGCLDFNERAVALIANTPSIRYVIMSSPFSGYLDAGELKVFNGERTEITDQSLAIERLIATIQDLRRLGKQAILVAPPPQPGFNIGSCHAQIGMGLVALGRRSCDFGLAEHQRHQQGVINAVEEVQKRTGAKVLKFDEFICPSGMCMAATESGVSVYKDEGHLSVHGSRWAVPKLGIDRIIGSFEHSPEGRAGSP